MDPANTSSPRVTCVWPVAAGLGEGPLWDDRRRCLWFVDIFGGAIHRFDPQSGAQRSFAIGGMPSFVVLTQGDDLVVGNGHELQLFDGERVTATLHRLDLPRRIRVNDATVDRSGRLWFGTMDMEEVEAAGMLFCRSEGAVKETGLTAIVTNGPAVSADCGSLYHADTVNRRILRYELAADGSVSNEQLFAEIEADSGFPDGLTLDAEDCLWVGLWQGSSLRRYSPNGRLLSQVDVPSRNVTKLAFGGAAFRTGYVTTARGTDTDPGNEAGGVFSFDTGCTGLPATAVRDL